MSILLFVIRYRKTPQAFYLNYLFYILFFALFYISLPSIISIVSGHSVVFASYDTINNTAAIGLYFVIFFFIAYFFSTDKSFNLERMARAKSRGIMNSTKIIVILISLYVCIVIIVKLPDILAIIDERGLQSKLSYYLEITYKIKPLFMVNVVLISYLFLNGKKKSNVINF